MYELRLREEREILEGSLIEFYRAAWPVMDAAPYQDAWHLEAVAEHLEAIAYGKIRKLCVNLPPRHSKTLMVSVCFNAWMWTKEPDEEFPLIGPAAKFMCLSYGESLAMDNAILTRRLVDSDWYQERWGHRVSLTSDQSNKHKFDTMAGGTRISGSFKSTVTGRGAGIRIYDDPHKMDEVESPTIREGVLKLYDTTLKSRITDPKISAEVLVAQRGHMNDLSAHFLSDPDVVHLNLPAEYDSTRRCATVIGWEDPRTEDGELLWPGRWGPKELAPYKRDPYEWSSQWQQMPRIREGAIIKEEWWQVYEVPKSGIYDFQPIFVIASLDTAFTEKTSNDYSALTIWAVYDDSRTKRRCIILVDAWKKRLELHGVDVPRIDGESDAVYMRRTHSKWGLVEWVEHSCKKRKVDRLLVENTARGHDVVKELQRIYAGMSWGIRPITPRGDKTNRGHAIVDLFTDGMIYAPAMVDEHGNVKFREWAEMVINDCAEFPHGSHDDVYDTVTQCLNHLRRETSFAVRSDEAKHDAELAAQHKVRAGPLYPC